MTLQMRGVSAGYGGAPAIRGIDLTVQRGEIVALVGANGAGKTTLIKTVSGLISPQEGELVFDGEPIGALSPPARVRRGIVQVPEGRHLFAGMTVEENLRLGAHVHRRRGQAEIARRMDAVCRRFPMLRERMHEAVGNFSGGQQQMVAIGRGLMADPRLLILDEPSLGLAPLVVAEIFRMIAGLREQGLAILLAEQNARMSLGLSDRGYVIENGRVALEGSGRELLRSPEVARRYLRVGGQTGPAAPVRDAELAARLRALIAG